MIIRAIAWGVGLWVGGMALIVAFGTMALYPVLAVPFAMLTAPAMWLVARIHLRSAPPALQPHAGLSLGAAIVAVQCVLDALGWWMIFRFNFPALPPAAREATAIALPVAYFWMLIVPWWESARLGREQDG